MLGALGPALRRGLALLGGGGGALLGPGLLLLAAAAALLVAARRRQPRPSPPRSRRRDASPALEGPATAAATAALGAACPAGPLRDGGAFPSLRSHLARKGLEIWLGALPWPVRRSQQRAALRRGRPGLPRPIRPGQARPLARRRLCPSLQGRADAIAANLLQKHLQGLWGVPNPTEESLARLVPCPPPLLAPLDPGTPQEYGTWASSTPAPGWARVPQCPGLPAQTHLPWCPLAPSSVPATSTSSASGQLAGSSLGAGTVAGGGEPHSGAEDEDLPAGVSSSIQRAPGSRDGGLPPGAEEPLGPPGPSTAASSPELPSPDEAAGPAVPKADVTLEANFAAAPGSRVANVEDGSRPDAAGPVGVPRLELSRDAHSKLWMHTARKCLETRLRILPAVVRRSLETPRPALPQLLPEGACRPGTRPERLAWPQLGASAGEQRPRSRPVPAHIAVPEALFLPEEQREALELHVRAKRLQSRGGLLGPCPGPAPPSPQAAPGEEGAWAAPGAGSLPGALGGSGDEAAVTSEAPGKRRGTPKPWAGPAVAVVSPVLAPAAAGSARGNVAAVPLLEKAARASAEARSRPETPSGQRGRVTEAEAGEDEEAPAAAPQQPQPDANTRGQEPRPPRGLPVSPEEPRAGMEEGPNAAAPAPLAAAQEHPAAGERPARRQGVHAPRRAPRQVALHGGDRSPPQRGRGCSPPASVATLRWSRGQILRALESGLQEMAQSWSQPDGMETPSPKQPPSPPLHRGVQPRMAEGPVGAPDPASGEPAPWGPPRAWLQVSVPWLEQHVVQRALGTFLLPPCIGQNLCPFPLGETPGSTQTR
ncbi:collagen alpha-1(I) chain-like [Apteryx mantelli]|uniref:Collagen alpha-1(I) chain-like n=1 Tax=Apteryx mantelli TaxID=2696672 RepID=A0ABM4G5S8_9AVES